MNHVVKSFRLLSVLIFFQFAVSASAKTLRELAQTSNLLLVLADRVSAGDAEVKKRSCGMSYEQISARSQKLKSLIDQKIDSLKKHDFRVLEKRVQTCELDCTCDIYALAFEEQEKPNEKVTAVLQQKASQMTSKQREKCVSQIKNICQKAKL